MSEPEGLTKETVRNLWEMNIGRVETQQYFESFVGMTDSIDGVKYPILVGYNEDGPVDGEIIQNSLFEDVVTNGEIDFDVDVPEKVEREFERIRREASEEIDL